jgi:type III pantothenate kinase
MSLLGKKILYVDIGSSTISWQIDDDYHSIEIENFQTEVLPQHQTSVIACVANHNLIQYFNNPIIAQPKPCQGLIFDYNLEQLGVDRFLGLLAGLEKHPKQDFMLVDIGTFVTIDTVQNGRHIDGGIAPGLKQLQAGKNFAGADSQKSWNIGTENMLRDYINNRAANFKGEVLITGGGCKMIAIKKNECHQNLVITGLKRYFQYEQ